MLARRPTGEEAGGAEGAPGEPQGRLFWSLCVPRPPPGEPGAGERRPPLCARLPASIRRLNTTFNQRPLSRVPGTRMIPPESPIQPPGEGHATRVGTEPAHRTPVPSPPTGPGRDSQTRSRSREGPCPGRATGGDPEPRDPGSLTSVSRSCYLGPVATQPGGRVHGGACVSRTENTSPQNPRQCKVFPLEKCSVLHSLHREHTRVSYMCRACVSTPSPPSVRKPVPHG